MITRFKRSAARGAVIALTLVLAGDQLSTHVLATGTATAMINDDGTDYTGRILVVIGKPATGTMTCAGETFDIMSTVIVNPGNGPAVLLSVGIAAAPGDRFEIIGQADCRSDFSKQVLSLRGLEGNPQAITVFEAIEPLAADSTGVVTSTPDEFGLADVIFVKKGGPPIRSVLTTCDPLEPGDRIVDLVDLGPGQDGNLYAAVLEY